MFLRQKNLQNVLLIITLDNHEEYFDFFFTQINFFLGEIKLNKLVNYFSLLNLQRNLCHLLFSLLMLYKRNHLKFYDFSVFTDWFHNYDNNTYFNYLLNFLINFMIDFWIFLNINNFQILSFLLYHCDWKILIINY